MGTDIHPAIEVRRNGTWRYYRPKELCRWYAETLDDPVRVAEINKRRLEYIEKNPTAGKGWKEAVLGERANSWDRCKYRLPEFFDERNYRVFAVLGNVRNGSGFAGVYTHDELPYIQDNRGFPDDISDEAKAKMSNEHSEGWVDLAELKAYDYNKRFTEGGVLDEEEFRKHLTTQRPPESWSGMISGGGVVVLSPADYAALFESPIDLLQGKDTQRRASYDTTKRYFIHATWERKLRGQIAALPDQWIPYLEKLVPKGGTNEDVRVVFDFDS